MPSWRWAPGRARPCARGCRAPARRLGRASQGRALAAPGRGLHAAPAGRDRRLHRLLCRHPPRDQCRQAVPARQPAAAQLQMGARSAITAAPRRSCRPARRCAGRTASASARTRAAPSFGPCRSLDYELELGVWIGPGNDAGHADPDRRGGRAHRRLLPAQRLVGARHPGLGVPAAGAVPGQELRHDDLALDRHARGAGALPRRPAARPAGDPQPLAYLLDEADQRDGAFDDRARGAAADRADARRGQRAASARRLAARAHMYWTVAQMVAHHTSNGCKLASRRSARLRHHLGTDAGRLRQPAGDHRGGKEPFALPNGETRTFLEDGDEIILRGHATAEGAATIGFGECRARVLPAITGGI